ncbi:hypothetical protein SLEP1_g18701 [Rubroshorea leprosula]|uniref:Prolamin-like domain-containing protein n=1 Tax=Rubroshorea leprosula TaxID=152421 RepID=A0AAV5J4B7_9ROSI|nr:hypothetical protein SLEP1_g18701 [Rubroshorea leprosula]
MEFASLKALGFCLLMACIVVSILQLGLAQETRKTSPEMNDDIIFKCLKFAMSTPFYLKDIKDIMNNSKNVADLETDYCVALNGLADNCWAFILKCPKS